METERRTIPAAGYDIPAIFITPAHPRGAAVVLPGYGGTKEELAGLGWRVAESGIAACIIDLRGHGEHPLLLDGNIRDDVEAAIRFCRRFGKVTAIGHSLGGRLALTSVADFHIALSPSISRTYGDRTQEMLKTLRSYRVRPSDLAPLISIQETLPVWEPRGNSPDTLVIYAERDASEIAEGCRALAGAGVHTVMVPGGMHSDIFLLEPAFAAVRSQIETWYGTP